MRCLGIGTFSDGTFSDGTFIDETFSDPHIGEVNTKVNLVSMFVR